MKKSILILGAGLMQKPAIQAALKLGYKVIVVDGNPDAVCIPLADRFEVIDLKNKEKIASFAFGLKDEEEISAVFTAGTDFSASVAYVAEKLGLPGHRYEACLNASIKTRMRGCFQTSHVPSPGFTSIEFPFPEQIRQTIHYPAVVKPVDNMGARGCRIIRTPNELDDAVQTAVKTSRTGKAILEEYMDGDEYSIDALVWNGTMTITGFADRHIFFQPYFIEMGHTMPSRIDGKRWNELVSTFALGVQALGLTCGAAKADIKYTHNGPMIGEIAARLSGGYMSGWTYPYASGCDLTEQALLIALGEEPSYLLRHRVPVPFTPPASCCTEQQPFELYNLPCVQTSAERAWISIPGTVKNVYGLDTAKEVPFVKDILPRVSEGDTVVFPRNNVEKCGNIIALEKDRDSAIGAAEEAVGCVTIVLDPENDKTDDFLSGKTDETESGFPPEAFRLDSEDRLAFESYCQSIRESAAVIHENEPVSEFVPECLRKKHIQNLEDWNHISFGESIERYDRLRRIHPALNAFSFWRALVRGGLQGILYVSDSEEKNRAI